MGGSSKVRVDIRALLEFYDTAPESSRRHATSINAIAGEDLGAGLLKHYFEKERGVTADILSDPCTPGTKKGARLDRWIRVNHPSSRPVLYQVEIKNWSAHAIGGRRLALEATEEELSAHKRKSWEIHWDQERQELKDPCVRKVIDRMKYPESCRCEKGSQFDVYPLLCMWDALHKDGTKNDPYFQVDLPQNTNGFSCFFVFSMSSYLRGIREDFIEIEMRAAVERIQWLHKLFHLQQ